MGVLDLPCGSCGHRVREHAHAGSGRCDLCGCKSAIHAAARTVGAPGSAARAEVAAFPRVWYYKGVGTTTVVGPLHGTLQQVVADLCDTFGVDDPQLLQGELVELTPGVERFMLRAWGYHTRN